MKHNRKVGADLLAEHHKSEQEAFLRKIAENEDDEMARFIYADWLDEHDEPEEAERQRKWKAAKDWLVEFAERSGGHDYGDDDFSPITYGDIVQAATDFMESKDGWWDGLTQHGSERLRDMMREDETNKLFWTNWEIVTGLKRPAGDKPCPFSCSC